MSLANLPVQRREMGATLDTLPAELLMQVTSNVKARKDLINLSQGSRRLYDIITPQAYRSIHLQESPRLASGLLRAILLNSNLAHWIRDLDVCLSTPTSLNPWDEFIDPSKPKPVSIDSQVLERAVDNASNSEQEKAQWLSDLGQGKSDAYIGLLLVSLVSLEQLCIRTAGDEVYCQKVIERASMGEKSFGRTSPTFPRLVSARILDIGRSRYFTSNKFAAFLRLPSLRSINATAIFDDDSPWRGQENSTISHISLTGQVCVNGLHGFLTSCKNLKSFVYVHCYPGTEDSFGAAKDTLECLSFKSYQRRLNKYSFVGSFAGFKGLKQLEIRVHFLRSPEDEVTLYSLLPSSLQALYIDFVDYDSLDWVLRQIGIWAAIWRKCTPQLTRLTIACSSVFSEDQETNIRLLCEEWAEMTDGQLVADFTIKRNSSLE
ncbi:predicted protein [Uncinocarpus reesii 1704]|uniref:F-box domain-containing protein n=1 Tax=Uncinocarpus reesii (strain UAMH 1704) TaxID=336963 RepID=C4JWY9_UNCRE|nr:uncharacterized protein UREG_06162 [Uncinocarpus reesii 1704]EEP81297.1 predicted protein [Uncinocarpus reesii 1704]